MKSEIVNVVNKCRKILLTENINKHDSIAILDHIKPILKNYIENIHIEELLKNLVKGTTASQSLLEMTCDSDNELILGFFSIPYNEDAFLECLHVKRVEIPEEVIRLVPNSNAIPVIVESCTDGFKNPLAVAVFPENYQGCTVEEKHYAYYLINKFVDRFNQYTKTEIIKKWNVNDFKELLEADNKTIKIASAIWVYLHEHYHRTGNLPIPKYLHIKNSRNGAGAEELRVDILSIVALMKLQSSNLYIKVAVQYILAERLIRYPLQACPKDNYDARSSIALREYLIQQKTLTYNNEKYSFQECNSNLLKSLEALSHKIACSEKNLLVLPDNQKRMSWSKILPDLARNNNIWSNSNYKN